MKEKSRWASLVSGFRNAGEEALPRRGIILSLVLIVLLGFSLFVLGLETPATSALEKEALKSHLDVLRATEAQVPTEKLVAAAQKKSDEVRSKLDAAKSTALAAKDTAAKTAAGQEVAKLKKEFQGATDNLEPLQRTLTEQRQTMERLTALANKKGRELNDVRYPLDTTGPLWMALLVGLLALLEAWVVLWLAGMKSGHDKNFFRSFAMGEDGEVSTSKFQAMLWMLAVVFAYFSLLALRVRFEIWGSGVPGLPTSLATALGLGTGTAVVSKYIAVGKSAGGRSWKRLHGHRPADTNRGGTPSSRHGTWVGLVRDEFGRLDVAKVFLLFWTVTALGVFLATVISQLHRIGFEAARLGQIDPLSTTFQEQFRGFKASFGLPDIEGGLTALVGLGQTLYLGSKLGSSETIRIVGVHPAVVRAGEKVTLTTSTLPTGICTSLSGGTHDQEIVQAIFDGVPVEISCLDAANGKFSFLVPVDPKRQEYRKKVDVSLQFEGVALQAVPMGVETSVQKGFHPGQVNLVGISPSAAKEGDEVSVRITAIPDAFTELIRGNESGFVEVLVGGIPSPECKVGKDTVTFKVPSKLQIPPPNPAAALIGAAPPVPAYDVVLRLFGGDAGNKLTLAVAPATPT
ncbi:hypothetical protein [Fimbriimonas ginsengisoli]|nr:hypothetical protein [Fimbriimonas ginsengisoli]